MSLTNIMETQPHISIWIEPGTEGGDLLDRIFAKNGITTESIIAGMKDAEVWHQERHEATP